MRVMFAAVVMVLALLEAVQGCDLKTTRGQERKGKRLYEEHCVVCHGERGKGDGYRSLNPPPADLTSPSVQQKLDADLLKTIHAGKPNTAMGAWRWVFLTRSPAKYSHMCGLWHGEAERQDVQVWGSVQPDLRPR